MNLIEIYFTAIVHCVYFDAFSLILCIFMIHIFYIFFTCTNVGTPMKAKAKSAQFIFFALLMI